MFITRGFCFWIFVRVLVLGFNGFGLGWVRFLVLMWFSSGCFDPVFGGLSKYFCLGVFNRVNRGFLPARSPWFYRAWIGWWLRLSMVGRGLGGLVFMVWAVTSGCLRGWQ